MKLCEIEWYHVKKFLSKFFFAICVICVLVVLVSMLVAIIAKPESIEWLAYPAIIGIINGLLAVLCI